METVFLTMTQISKAIKKKTIIPDHIKWKNKKYYMTKPVINMIIGKLVGLGRGMFATHVVNC